VTKSPTYFSVWPMSHNGLAQLYRRRALAPVARVRTREAGLSFLTTFRRAHFMTMLGISGVELPERRPHPVSSLRLGDPPHNSCRAAPHPTGHRQSRVWLPNVATRVSHREVQLFFRSPPLPRLLFSQSTVSQSTCKSYIVV